MVRKTINMQNITSHWATGSPQQMATLDNSQPLDHKANRLSIRWTDSPGRFLDHPWSTRDVGRFYHWREMVYITTVLMRCFRTFRGHAGSPSHADLTLSENEYMQIQALSPSTHTLWKMRWINKVFSRTKNIHELPHHSPQWFRYSAFDRFCQLFWILRSELLII